MTTGVSVVIPLRNGATLIGETLRSVWAQGHESLQVILVDDGSSDGGLELALACADERPITVLRGSGRGAAAALNAGLRQASHPIVCQIDQDVVLEPGWIAAVIRQFDAPDVAAVQGIYVTDVQAPLLARVMGRDLEERYAAIRLETDHVCTGNVAYRLDALRRIGFFDEGLGYGYDNDVSYRLRDAGYRLVICSEARSLHRWRDSLAGYFWQQYGFGYGRLDLVAKHPARVGGDDVSPTVMMLHPLVLLAAMLTLAAGFVVTADGRALWIICLSLVIALTIERTVAGIRAARRFRDLTPLWFPLVHFVRDLAWVLAILAWTTRRLLGTATAPAHSMRARGGNSAITARIGARALGPNSSARDYCAAHTRAGGGNPLDRDLSVVTRRSHDLCRPAAISGAIEAISRLTQQPAGRYRSLAQQSLAEHLWPKDRELGGESSLGFVAPGGLSTTNGPSVCDRGARKCAAPCRRPRGGSVRRKANNCERPVAGVSRETAARAPEIAAGHGPAVLPTSRDSGRFPGRLAVRRAARFRRASRPAMNFRTALGPKPDTTTDGLKPDTTIERVLIVIPAFNEATNLHAVVTEIRATISGAEILIVDDGSTDNTEEIVSELPVRWLRLPERMGVGTAMRAGLRYAKRQGFTVVARLDGDGQHKPDDLSRLIGLVSAGHADIAFGSRGVWGRGTADVTAGMLKGSLAACLSVLTRRRILDPTCGLSAMGPRAVRLLAECHPTGYPEPELRLLISRTALAAVDVDIDGRPRLHGRTTLTPLRLLRAAARVLLAICVIPLRRAETEPIGE